MKAIINMKKLLLLILNIFLSFLIYISFSLFPYREGFESIILMLVGFGGIGGLLFSFRFAIHKVYSQRLGIKDERIKIAIIQSSFWAIGWTTYTVSPYLIFSSFYSYSWYLVSFLIGFLPLLYFLMKDNQIGTSTFKLRIKELNTKQKFKPIKFEIKQFFWLILLSVSTIILSVGTSFEYALGVISSNILRDGVILTLLVFTFFYFYKKKKWQWYEWLNMLAYTTITANYIYKLIV